ncbi:MAG: type III-A CRISPR-associated protein Cas10/Csm1 [candidate division KSB1 bacterium]|nr:type III-A CRISPR-associated protein Cas10/Csm1 [candidate division KSB1 bacterium]
MADRNEVYRTALAGLLHDIGKFAQRAGWQQGRHAEVGARWIGCNRELFPYGMLEDLVDAVAEHHHELPRKRIAKVVRLADWMAAGERRTEQMPRSEPDSTPLIPILSCIALARPRPEETWGFNLTCLSLDRNSLFPQPQLKTIDAGLYEGLWERFEEEVARLRAGGVVITGEQHFISLLSLLRKYTRFMPSATPWEAGDENRERTVPDVSLYDHSKVTAAIAACLERGLSDDEVEQLLRGEDAAWQQPVARMVRADISGIQRFIYRITRPAGDAAFRGAAKRLRGRSFYLVLLGDVVGDWLLRRLGLTAANLLFCGGGRFDLLVPKDVNTRQELDRCLDELEGWLLKSFYGELGIQFAEAEVTPADFRDMRRLYSELEHKLVQAKSRKWQTRIGKTDFYISAKDEYHACPICHLTSMPEARACPTCEQHHDIGGKLPDTTHIAIVYGKPNVPGAVSVPFDALGITALLMDQEQVQSLLKYTKQGPISGVLYRLNDTDFIPSDVPAGLDVGFRFVANSAPVALEEVQFPGHEPTKCGDVLDFEEIARLSTGAARLGVLKADVDLLGLLFSDGLEPATISRQAALSQAIDLFFCGWLNRLCAEVSADRRRTAGEKCPQCGQVSNLFYVLYAGGDDLFVIGPWDQTLELARRLQADLADYACHNPNVTISAGVVQVKPHYPIQRFAELVDERLKTAKDHGRNCLNAFAQTLPWQADVSGLPGLDSVLDFAQQLAAAVGEDTLPRSFVHYLGRLYRQHFVLEADNGKPNLMFLPKLQYAIRRRVRKEVDEALQLMDRLWWQKMMWYTPFLVSYVSLSTREE